MVKREQMFDFLQRKLRNEWSDSSPESRLEVSVAGYQGCLDFDRRETPEILRLRKDLLSVSFAIQIRAVTGKIG